MDKILAPLVSVILPVFNSEDTISIAVDSILNQTFTDFELIIINDGSKDKTEKIILSYKDPRIVFIRNEFNLGIVKSLNKGLKLAKGKYIARMDADDISYPIRFDQQVSFLESNKDIGICGTAVKASINGKEKILYYPFDDKNIRLQLLDRPSFSHPSIMIRNDVIKEYQISYCSEFEHNEDYRLYIDLLKITRSGNLRTPLLYYNTLNAKRISTVNKHKMTELRTKNRTIYAQTYFNISEEESKLLYGDIGWERISIYKNLESKINADEKKLLSQIWYTDTLYHIKENYSLLSKYLYILSFDFSFINLKRWLYLFNHLINSKNDSKN